MKSRIALFCAIMLLWVMLAACSDNVAVNSTETTVPSEQAVSSETETPSVASPSSSPTTAPSIPPSSSVSSENPSAPTTVSSSSALTSASSATEATVPAITISVTPDSQEGPFESFEITNETDQQSILNFLDNMEPIAYDPFALTAGGYLFWIDVTQNGVTEEYALRDSESADFTYILQNGDWHATDYDLWKLLLSYYPKFDLEKNQPVTISLSPSKGGTVAFSYYYDDYFSWSEEEQAKGETVLAYLDALEVCEDATAIVWMSDYIEMDVWDWLNDTEVVYTCYQQDERSIVKKNGEWFLSDFELYEYLYDLVPR